MTSSCNVDGNEHLKLRWGIFYQGWGGGHYSPLLICRAAITPAKYEYGTAKVNNVNRNSFKSQKINKRNKLVQWNPPGTICTLSRSLNRIYMDSCCNILTKFSSLVALEVVKMPTFPFQCTWALNLRALKFQHCIILQWIGKIFCVEFQRYPLKFHTKNLTQTLKDVHFIQMLKFKSS